MNRILISVVFLLSLISHNVFAENTSTVDLLYKIDNLQKELSLLRGQMEELQFEVDKLKQKQHDQYVDVDRRLQQLTQQVLGTGQSSVPMPPLNLDEPSQATVPPVVEGNSAPLLQQDTPVGTTQPISPKKSEKEAYEDAFKLITQKNYKQAAEELKQFVQIYPDNEYTANAYYWLGEMQLLSPDLPAAKVSFEKVISRFSNHHKVPDAMYKLGVVYHQLGDNIKAIQQLEALLAKFPGTTAANLARQYMQNLN